MTKTPEEQLAEMAQVSKELHRMGHSPLCDRQLANQLEAYFCDEENELAELYPRVLKVLEEELLSGLPIVPPGS